MLHVNLTGDHSWQIEGLPSLGRCEPDDESSALTRMLATGSVSSSSWVSVLAVGITG